ncbi:unnamed protein product [Paramecium octaurelia]|uniref:RING-type domain-containing protein n=1 Tax=Paramecium octaurelia TaxID=43137 RepID=A0A8S1TJV1_PAROT|nr:unnamed protein product [Paramecium octaurelia]
MNFAKSQILVDFSENDYWTTLFNTSSPITFKVTSLKEEYCYVKIELFSKDPTFLLMADYKIRPNINLISQYKQGEKIDRISQLENRGTRFLKLKGKLGTIYITTTADNIYNQYQITITGNNEDQCDNECNYGGVCKSDGCFCQSSFIGNDCHQSAVELPSGSERDVDFLVDETIKFFSIDLSYLIGQKLKLEFETDCDDCLTIIIYKTKALLGPEDSLNSNYTYLFYITDGSSTIQTYVPQTLAASQQILYLAVSKQYSIYETPHLSIKCNYFSESNDDDDSTDYSNKLLYIIIPTVFGSILCFIIIGCLLRRKRTYTSQAAQVAQDPFSQQTRNGNAQDPFSQQNRMVAFHNPIQQQYPQQKFPVSQFLWQKDDNNNDDNDKCIICLMSLNHYNNQTIKIRCGHVFHRNCIVEWCQKQISSKKDHQSDCPYCRQPMNLNEIF